MFTRIFPANRSSEQFYKRGFGSSGCFLFFLDRCRNLCLLYMVILL